ncbi:Bro-N domain-containing protein [Acinetobacter sp. Marseille-P8610]|uniref:BRO-N domain-containing protein n=1 Tax=Acinetobacter sp. Marseille-P8610 TaxID=2864459 RepID=UPI001CE410A2|nr:BRO family protein [Acinetobacter sp. Marseille-P8610]
MTSLALTFNDVNFSPIQHDQQIWLSSGELAQALGYKQENAVSKIFNRNSDEFTEKMTQIIDNPQLPNLGMRIFSLRGCHLIAMFARTTVAKQFRKWVLDVLDKHIGAPVCKTHKSERTALHEAHAMLVAKTKHLNSSDAWKIINQRFGTNSIEEISYDQIPVAVEYVHHLIALYSNTGKQGSLFDKDVYELIRNFTESVLSQNFMMQNIWQALMLINKSDMMYYSKYVLDSNELARKVSMELDFKTRKGAPLVSLDLRQLNFHSGTIFEVSPKWFNAPAW